MLVRGLARRAEVSIRMALGAGRARVVRQMVTESVVLACLGGMAGLVLAYAGTSCWTADVYAGTDMPVNAMPALPVLGFAFAVSVVTGLIFGVAPAWMRIEGTACECDARLEPLDARRIFRAAAVAGCAAGGVVGGVADWRWIAGQKPGQAAASGPAKWRRTTA